LRSCSSSFCLLRSRCSRSACRCRSSHGRYSSRCVRRSIRGRCSDRHRHMRGSRAGRQIVKHAAIDAGMPRRTQIRQKERGAEKDCCSNTGRFGQEIGRAGRTKQTAGRSGTECSAHVRAFTVLHENQTDNRQRRQDLHQHNDIDKHCIH